MPDYDRRQFDPPAPLAGVLIRRPDHAKSISDVAMLIDSGADVSLIPASCADRLALRGDADEEFALRGFDNSGSVGRAVNAEVVLLGRLFRGRFLIIDQDYGVLGRNVLNHLTLLLDGPRLQWHLDVG